MLELDQAVASTALANDLAQRLRQESAYFRRLGVEGCLEAIEGLLLALREDLSQRKMQALRTYLATLIPRHVANGLTSHDLRALCQLLRRQLLATLDQLALASLAERRQQLEDWLHELALSAVLYYSAQRDATIADQAARLEIQLGELRAAYELLRQIWIPMAPVYDGVLVLPLVGALDSQRAAGLMERLLAEVGRNRARFVLLDISGVPLVDSAIAQHLIHMSRAVQLLGAQLVLVGISPEIAQTIIHLGLDLSSLTTQSSLREGLQYALARMGRVIVAQ